MSNSAIATPQFQAKIGSIQNQADTSAVYNGGIWSFKNSTALTSVTITDAGNVGVGATTTSAKLTIKNPNVSGEQQILDIQNAANTTQIASVSFSQTDDMLKISNKTNTGYISFGIGGSATERMRIDASGNISVGSGGVNANNFVFNYTGGAVRPSGDNNQNFGLSTNRWANIFAGNGTIQTSDERLKKNIVPLPSMLGKVLQLKPSSWESKYDSYFVGSSGFIAQELEQVFPNLVQTQPETVEGHENIKTISVAGAEMVAILVKAIQELSAKVDAQAAEIEALKAK